MGIEWKDGPRSPMDTGGDSGSSGGGNTKLAMFAIIVFGGGAAAFVSAVAYVVHGWTA